MKTNTNFFRYAANAVILRHLLLVIVLTSSSAAFSQEKERGIHVGFFYPLSTHGTNAPEYSNVFSLHAIAGVSKNEKAFTVSGITSIINNDASGFQVAGISNHIGGFAEGFKAAGILNMYRSANGFQAAGFMNLAQNNVTGMQAAGFMNMSGDVHGFQAGGFMNMAHNIRGMQAAGYINMADDVEGAQVSGFINIAKKVKGIQAAGFINIADSSDYPIGFINIIGNGEKFLGVTTDDNLTTLLAFRSGGRKLYGILGLGYNFQNSKEVFAWQYGLGAHLLDRRMFRLNAEATTVSLDNFKRGQFDKFSLTLLPALKLGDKLEIFAGPSLNWVNTNTAEGKRLIEHYTWSDINSHNRLNGIYFGYTAGVHFKL